MEEVNFFKIKNNEPTVDVVKAMALCSQRKEKLDKIAAESEKNNKKDDDKEKK